MGCPRLWTIISCLEEGGEVGAVTSISGVGGSGLGPSPGPGGAVRKEPGRLGQGCPGEQGTVT